MVTLIEDLLERYNDLLSTNTLKTEGVKTSVSYKRNMPYNSDTYSNKGNEVVFDVVLVVRDHPIKQCCDTEEEFELYYQELYGLASQVMNLWYSNAVNIWEGEHTRQLKQIKTPLPKTSESTITIFGQVCDKNGRTYSITATEDTLPFELNIRNDYSNWLYDDISQTCGSIDMNAYGKSTYGIKASVPKTSKPKTTPKPTGAKINLGKQQKPTDVSSVVKELDTVSELRKLPNNTDFSIKIIRADTDGNGKMVCYGYDCDINNNLVESIDGIIIDPSDIVNYTPLMGVMYFKLKGRKIITTSNNVTTVRYINVVFEE